MSADQLRIAQAVVAWIDTARESNPRYPANWLPTNADIMKSALLARLLEGLSPFDIAPPRAFSYPWYELVEREVANLHDFAVDGPFILDSLPDPVRVVSISQCPWEILAEHTDSNDPWYLVRYHLDGGVWELRHRRFDDPEPEPTEMGRSIASGEPVAIWPTWRLSLTPLTLTHPVDTTVAATLRTQLSTPADV